MLTFSQARWILRAYGQKPGLTFGHVQAQSHAFSRTHTLARAQSLTHQIMQKHTLTHLHFRFHENDLGLHGGDLQDLLKVRNHLPKSRTRAWGMIG